VRRNSDFNSITSIWGAGAQRNLPYR